MGYQKNLLLLIAIITAFVICAARKKGKKLVKDMVLREKETNAVDFIRLLVMRLIYGVATRIGLGENISDALNGAFVPPGVDADEDYFDDFNLEDREDYLY